MSNVKIPFSINSLNEIVSNKAFKIDKKMNFNGELNNVPSCVVIDNSSNSSNTGFGEIITTVNPVYSFTSELTSNNKRYSFSARNSNSSNEGASSSSASSSEIYTDYEEKSLIKNKALICFTDGSSTSFKFLDKDNNNTNYIHINDYYFTSKPNSNMLDNNDSFNTKGFYQEEKYVYRLLYIFLLP
jgi:hypothetical protein